jgi:aminopeptidase N
MLFNKTVVTSNNLTIWFLRENTVFNNECDSNATSKQGILLLVAEEFAHFWFGKLWTPKWWSYLRLNVGFAT